MVFIRPRLTAITASRLPAWAVIMIYRQSHEASLRYSYVVTSYVISMYVWA
jgi:hypothetical protein